MSEGSKAKEIVLGSEFGDIAIKANGALIEVHADGSLDVHTTGSIAAYTTSDVDAYTNGAVHVHPAADDSGAVGAEPQTGPEIGDVMPAGHKQAGWIYAGISKTTHEPFYVAPKDSGIFQWKAAMVFAAKDGSRVPSQDELDQIYKAKDKGALKGTFNETGSGSAGWSWSSRGSLNSAWAQRFSDGGQTYYDKGSASSLRCVR